VANLNFNIEAFTKVCGGCNTAKPITQFHKSKRTKDGLQTRCAECNNKAGKEWARKNRKKVAARQKELRRQDPRNHMCHAAKYRAKRDDLPFDLKYTDFKIPEFCPVLGIPLVMGEGKHHSNSPTLDKIIPQLGYVKDNVIVVSHRANSLKSDATLEELKQIYEFYCG
jgi:hypothetical protein